MVLEEQLAVDFNEEELTDMVLRGIQRVIKSAAFLEWFDDKSPDDDDIIVLNNSFIYRSPVVKTSKNVQYLGLQVTNQEPDLSKVYVVEPTSFNADFRLFSRKADNYPELMTLSKALQREMDNLGHLVFVLIGGLEAREEVVEINHAAVDAIRLVPQAEGDTVIEDEKSGKRYIVVNQLLDPMAAWSAIEAKLSAKLEATDDPTKLKSAFITGFEKLQKNARLNLDLPEPGYRQSSAASFLDHLYNSVQIQRQSYEEALEKMLNTGTADNVHRREVMRVAYNFSGDAITILQLLVSIADLKGILFWCTVAEHFEVAESFRQLPWTKSDQKPSLKDYQQQINGARNRAFHDLFSFDRTIEANLAGIQVNARRLTLLPAHKSSKGSNHFDYEDQEIIEILTTLTRAPETAVPKDFWEKNLSVIKAFESLLAGTRDAFWALNHARARD